MLSYHSLSAGNGAFEIERRLLVYANEWRLKLLALIDQRYLVNDYWHCKEVFLLFLSTRSQFTSQHNHKLFPTQKQLGLGTVEYTVTKYNNEKLKAF
jgi:hypothetical protein